jgi:hypothetical protein
MLNLISRKDAKAACLKRYYTGKPCKHGQIDERRVHDGACCECQRVAYRKYSEDNSTKERERKRSWMQEFRDELTDDEREAYNNSFYERYPDSYKLNAHVRHKAFKDATPPWVDMSAIKDIYRNCPEGHHVDHIIPLRGIMPDGSRVSGLHVPWNLQYLPARVNRGKSNKVQLHEINDLM